MGCHYDYHRHLRPVMIFFTLLRWTTCLDGHITSPSRLLSRI